MTNTLHRFGKPEDLKDDYVVFCTMSKGINDANAQEAVHAFLKAALKYNPINIGNTLKQALYRPEKDLNPIKLYFAGRKEKVSFEEAIQESDGNGAGAVVFDNKESLEGFLRDVKELDLGISVNVSALVDVAREASEKAGITPHAMNLALGFRGDISRLPDRHVLALTTMCGHGMISANFARKLIDRVKEGRTTPEKAAGYMAKFCVCGVFNTTRAVRILNEVRTSN